jgi:predicted nucleic acid-binding protein
VDRSVWIDFFNPRATRAGKELRRLIADGEPIGVTEIVVTEILQGLTRDSGQIESYLAMWDILEPHGFRTYREAAGIFRTARAKGITLSTIDALIAAIALEHGADVFSVDEDFMQIARIANLTLHPLP